MKIKELKPIIIENSSGGNQDWFSDYWMKLGGCAAVTACDSCIFLAREYGYVDLYPYNLENLTKKDYIAFSKVMKPYLRPRFTGIDKLEIYREGIGKYFEDRGINNIIVKEFSGESTLDECKKVVKMQINNNILVPCLVLKHKKKELDDYVWHWFLLMGYKEEKSMFMVKTVTYNRERWFSLDDIWNSGYKRKGGLIIFE